MYYYKTILEDVIDINNAVTIHYYSRHFKKATSMSPSEHANSIKVII